MLKSFLVCVLKELHWTGQGWVEEPKRLFVARNDTLVNDHDTCENRAVGIGTHVVGGPRGSVYLWTERSEAE